MGERSSRVFGYGHLGGKSRKKFNVVFISLHFSGDCNLHLQIAVDNFSHEIKNFIESYVFKRVIELKGSISAEHGMEFTKGKYLNEIKTKEYATLMRNLKKTLDPNSILNPYKMFPALL